MSNAGFASYFHGEIAVPDTRIIVPSDIPGMISLPVTRGRFFYEIITADGKVRDSWYCDNGTTNAGANDILSVYFNSGTQKTTWYIGLIDNTGFTALNAGDTAASHSGWNELTSYSESVRQTWTPSAPSGQSITNPTACVFTQTATVTINGGFLSSVNTKGGTTGILYATGSFSAPKTLNNTEQLKVTYACNATVS